MTQYMKPSEVAQILNIGLAKIYQLCNSADFPAIQIGDESNYKKKTWRIEKVGFENWLKKQSKGSN